MTIKPIKSTPHPMTVAMSDARAGDQKRVVIVGATGMVGGYALRYALAHPSVGLVTSIGRRRVGISHPKLKEVMHQDFADCSRARQQR